MQFRQATPRDLMDALRGWREANGVKPQGSGMTRKRMDELKAQYG
jgi:hypothetical protein